jgi:Domain of unknown function (DUF1937)
MISLLSCPYSSRDHDVREERYQAAVKASAFLVSLGVIPVCPVLLNHPIEQLLIADGSTMPSGYWKLFEKMIETVCDEVIIYTMPGWTTSQGVKREVEMFVANGKTVRNLNCDFLLSEFIDFQKFEV